MEAATAAEKAVKEASLSLSVTRLHGWEQEGKVCTSRMKCALARSIREDLGVDSVCKLECSVRSVRPERQWQT